MEALQAVVAGSDDVLGAKAWAGGKLGDLGCDHEFAAILGLKPGADDGLGFAALVAWFPFAIDIGAIDEVATVGRVGV